MPPPKLPFDKIAFSLCLSFVLGAIADPSPLSSLDAGSSIPIPAESILPDNTIEPEVVTAVSQAPYDEPENNLESEEPPPSFPDNAGVDPDVSSRIANEEEASNSSSSSSHASGSPIAAMEENLAESIAEPDMELKTEPGTELNLFNEMSEARTEAETAIEPTPAALPIPDREFERIPDGDSALSSAPISDSIEEIDDTISIADEGDASSSSASSSHASGFPIAPLGENFAESIAEPAVELETEQGTNPQLELHPLSEMPAAGTAGETETEPTAAVTPIPYSESENIPDGDSALSSAPISDSIEEMDDTASIADKGGASDFSSFSLSNALDLHAEHLTESIAEPTAQPLTHSLIPSAESDVNKKRSSQESTSTQDAHHSPKKRSQKNGAALFSNRGNRAQFMSAAGIGAVTGLVTGNQRKGTTGDTGPIGPTGAAGPIGPTGNPYTYPTGPATLTFTFTEDGLGNRGNWRGIIVTPSHAIHETPIMVNNGAPSTVAISIPAPAELGRYTVAFYQLSSDAFPAQGSCQVTNDRNSHVWNFTSNVPSISVGAQISQDFLYDVLIIP
jgi:hypothetical protein